MLEVDPTNSRALLAAGQAYLQTGALSMAAYNFDLVLQIMPADLSARQGKAECDLKQGNAKAALMGFESVLELDAQNERAINGRLAALAQMPPDMTTIDEVLEAGQMLMSRGRARESGELFQGATTVSPEDPRAWAGLGKTSLSMGDFGAARDAFERALELSPTDRESQLGAGQAYLGLQNFEPALEFFEVACAADALDLGAQLGRGDALLGMGRFSAALDCYAAVLQIDANSLRAFIGKGQTHLEVGEMDAAERSFAFALGIEPGNALALAGTRDVFHKSAARRQSRG